MQQPDHNTVDQGEMERRVSVREIKAAFDHKQHNPNQKDYKGQKKKNTLEKTWNVLYK